MVKNKKETPEKKTSKKADNPKSTSAGKSASEKKSTAKEPEKKPRGDENAPVFSRPQLSAPTPGRKRLLVSYEKLPSEVLDVIREKYPHGYNHDLKEVRGIDNKKFFVLPIETTDATYLVKVDLRKPIKMHEIEEDEEIFSGEEDFGGDEDGFPTEDLEQIEAGGDDDDDK